MKKPNVTTTEIMERHYQQKVAKLDFVSTTLGVVLASVENDETNFSCKFESDLNIALRYMKDFKNDYQR